MLSLIRASIFKPQSFPRVAACFSSFPHPVPNVEVKHTKLFINNEFVNSSNGKTFDLINPCTEEKFCEVSDANKADVDLAVKAAKNAFAIGSEWRQTSGSQRAKLLYRLAELIEENQAELSSLESLNCGKPFSEAIQIDMQFVIKCYRYYAGLAGKSLGNVTDIDGDFMSITRPEPVGVCGQIIPWNFPLMMQAWKLGPALASGCTVVMKTAEQTPLTALYVADLIKQAGFPPGVVNILSGFGPEVGAPIAEHMDVDKLAFTGSTEIGQLVAGMAVKSNLKRVSLELGGKSPNVVFADADMENAVTMSELGLFLNGGQCCCAGSRIFVEESAYDQFVERIVEKAKERVLGNPLDLATTQGPQVNKDQFEKIMNLIDSGKKEGATLCTGGGRGLDKGFFVQPTVFKDVRDDMTIAQEEIFGPVMQIMKFKTMDEVVARANNTKYGLAAAVFTQDIDKANEIAHSVRAGTLWVNCYDVLDPAASFGGYKMSGWGRELGTLSLDAYTERKVITTKLKRRIN